MRVLSDSIELFIKELMGACGEISLQRNELAQHFDCAPSQINYVLATRFTLERGYITDSRRGGGGYIRVSRVDDGDLIYELARGLEGESLTRREAQGIIARLAESELITKREANIMLAAMQACSLPTAELGDSLRGKVMGAMLTGLLREGEG